MLRWLKNKQLNEQKKLLYQNGMASTSSLKSYLAAQGEREIVGQLARFEAENQRIAELSRRESLPAEDIEMLIRMNRELRRLFDQTAMRHVKSFDDTYKPLRGWEEYYKQ